MSLDWFLLLCLMVGHVSLFVVVVNVVHALGMTDERMHKIKILLLVALFSGMVGILYEFSQGAWDVWSFPLRVYTAVCLAISLIGIPTTTILRHRRSHPVPISERSNEIDFAAIHGADALIGEGRYASLLRIKANESLRLCKREWEVTVPSLPAALDGLSLLQITDLHFAPCFQRKYFELVAAEAKAWEADLVLFTGDLIDHHESLDWIVPVLSGLKGRLGTYAILGNHDYDQDHQHIGKQLEVAGFTNLEGAWARLEVDGKTLALGGTSYPWGPMLDLRYHSDADFRILLSHSPDLFYRAASAGIDLMLSGHNHGGQIRLPIIGPVFMPSVFSRHFDRGFFQSQRTLLHVSQGIAGKHPIRIGCVPEIGRFILRAPRETAAQAA
ncbi:metallophosphoesterase, partial [Singulisphaera rosea]